MGDKATKPTDPIKTGYTFKYWCLDLSNPVEFDFSTEINDITDLYAYFEINEYTVTFNANGGAFAEGEGKPEEVEYNGYITMSDVPTNGDFVFAGWFAENGDEYTSTSGNITSAITLYAKWYAKYSTTVEVTSDFNFYSLSALPSDNNGVAFGKKGKTVEYSLKGVTYTSINSTSGDMNLSSGKGLKLAKKTQEVNFDVIKGATVTIYLRNGNSGTERMFDIVSTAGLQILNICKNYADPNIEGVSVTNGNAIGESKNGNGIVVTIAVSTDQTISIKYSSNSTSENEINIQRIVVAYPIKDDVVIKSISATVTPENGAIAISDIKLTDINDTKYTITTGYKVYLDGAETALDENGKITGVSAGEHTVKVQYGTYTVYETTVTVTE